MDNIIYEKDYRQEADNEEDVRRAQILDRAISGGFFEAYSKEMDKIPKYIVPEDKANYEYLLEHCEKFVERFRGHIKGVVDYQKWQSEIVMTLPFAEFGDPEDRAFLAEIAEKSHSVTFEPSASSRHLPSPLPNLPTHDIICLLKTLPLAHCSFKQTFPDRAPDHFPGASPQISTHTTLQSTWAGLRTACPTTPDFLALLAPPLKPLPHSLASGTHACP